MTRRKRTGRRTVEEHRVERDTPAWLFEAARAHFQWPECRLLSAADYEAAIATTEGISLSSPTIHTDRGRAHERADRMRRER